MSKGEQTRQEIVERALALAGEVGLEGVSLGVLAASLNLLKSGLFAPFKSKEAKRSQALFWAGPIGPTGRENGAQG